MPSKPPACEASSRSREAVAMPNTGRACGAEHPRAAASIARAPIPAPQQSRPCHGPRHHHSRQLSCIDPLQRARVRCHESSIHTRIATAHRWHPQTAHRPAHLPACTTASPCGKLHLQRSRPNQRRSSLVEVSPAPRVFMTVVVSVHTWLRWS